LLGYLFLDETVGPRRLAACAVGFAGTMLVVQPAFAEVGLPALIPLAVALVFALYMLLSRALGPRLDPIAGQAIAAPIAIAVLIPLGLLQSAPLLPLAEIQENPSTGWLILAMGIVGTVAHLAMAWALKYAPASTLAPLQYLEIPVAVFYGWLVRRDMPDPLAAIGIAVIMGAGVYLILRERAAERVTRRASAVPVPAPRAVPPVPPSAE
jgi:drug/metabolite transporter (DMT)-like permease